MASKPKAVSDKVIVVDNPSNLPLVPLKDIHEFQQDLKKDPNPRAFKKLVDSILNHHIFIGKAIFYEDGIAYTEDGHQTIKALQYLQGNGYIQCKVISYAMQDGRMIPKSEKVYDEIMVPCQVIVPVGETKEERFKDAVIKILQINSRYAEINTETKLFAHMGFDDVDFNNLVNATEIPELMKFNEMGGDSFLEEFNAIKPETAQYPIIPQFNEKYAAIIIVCRNLTEIAGVETILKLGKTQSYDKSKKIGIGHVLTAETFFEIWKEHEDVYNKKEFTPVGNEAVEKANGKKK